MTTEREAMTLAEAREVVADVYSDFCRPNFTDRHGDKPRLKAAIAAIDTHLSRAAEPVAWLVSQVGPTCVDAAFTDRKEADECAAAWDYPVIEPLYTHPSEDARDAARLDAIDKWTAAGRRIEFAKSLYSAGVEIGLHEPIKAFARNSVREAIDAAMAKENENV